MTPRQSALAKAKSQCDHRSGVNRNEDHIECKVCHAVKPDALWNHAALKWFKSMDEAVFYDKHRRLPEGEVIR